jgi:UTP--glucose-1-phosphate uridylyltransferase
LKGVIVAAGYGTRFFPVTKTIPKEMLPIINKPSIDFIIEEFIASGITEILVISSRRKKSLEDYLDSEIELETALAKSGKTDLAKKIAPPPCDFYFVRQREMKGTGHAILLAEPFVGDSPFVVAYPDDIFFGGKPVSLELIEEYNSKGCSVLATVYDPPNLSRYGIIAPGADNLHVTEIVEKPKPGNEPSKEASIGRFLFMPEIFGELRSGLDRHSGGEYFHTVGINALAKKGRVVYKRVGAKRLDTGEPLGLFEATLEYASLFPEFARAIKKCALKE